MGFFSNSLQLSIRGHIHWETKRPKLNKYYVKYLQPFSWSHSFLNVFIAFLHTKVNEHYSTFLPQNTKEKKKLTRFDNIFDTSNII